MRDGHHHVDSEKTIIVIILIKIAYTYAHMCLSEYLPVSLFLSLTLDLCSTSSLPDFVPSAFIMLNLLVQTIPNYLQLHITTIIFH